MDMDNYEDLYFDVENPGDKVQWAQNFIETKVFRFVGEEEEFYLFRDYPYKLTKEQKEIFDKENPFWADFFKDRN